MYLFIRYLSELDLSKINQLIFESFLYIMIYKDNIYEFISYLVMERNKRRLEQKLEKRLEENLIRLVKLLKRSMIYKFI